MNSEALTDPMTVRGAVLPCDRSVLVVTGPQPPPPDASMKPPKSPSGARNFVLWLVPFPPNVNGVRNENRSST